MISVPLLKDIRRTEILPEFIIHASRNIIYIRIVCLTYQRFDITNKHFVIECSKHITYTRVFLYFIRHSVFIILGFVIVSRTIFNPLSSFSLQAFFLLCLFYCVVFESVLHFFPFLQDAFSFSNSHQLISALISICIEIHWQYHYNFISAMLIKVK